MSNRSRPDPRRLQLAYEAARIMTDRGDEEFERARRKAAQRAGVGNRRLWPSNEEIRDALRAQQRLFQGERQAAELAHLREQALIAMGNLARFSPRLVGPVLDGSADGRQPVRLLVFAQRTEDLVFALMEQGIPWQQQDRMLRFSGGDRRSHPLLTFYAGEIHFELIVLPPSAQSNPPLDIIGERPQRGAGANEVRRMLAEVSFDAPSACGVAGDGERCGN